MHASEDNEHCTASSSASASTSSTSSSTSSSSTSSSSSSFAQRACAGAGALLLSLSPLLVPLPPLSPPAALAAAMPSVKYLTREELSTVELFKRATPSVVFVTALADRRDALTLDVTQMPAGAGSGIVWDTEGHVVTNYHVVKDATELRVTVAGSGGDNGGMYSGGGGGGEFRAKLIGADPDRDVALLELAPFADPTPEDDDEAEAMGEFFADDDDDGMEEKAVAFGKGGEAEGEVVAVASSTTSTPPAPPLRLPPPKNLRPRPPLVPLRRGTSAGLEVGQTVYAIGNPFGLSSTLTKGILR